MHICNLTDNYEYKERPNSRYAFTDKKLIRLLQVSNCRGGLEGRIIKGLTLVHPP